MWQAETTQHFEACCVAHHVELQVGLAGHMPHLLELPALDQVGKLGLQAIIDKGCTDL